MKLRYLFMSAATALSCWLLGVTAHAESGSGEAARFGLADAARFFGMFLLVMGAIFAALLLTGWLGRWRDKHKK